MSFAERKAVELIDREIAKIPKSTPPYPDRTYTEGMIELAYAAGLIGCEQYRGYTAQIHQLADERWQELRGVPA